MGSDKVSKVIEFPPNIDNTSFAGGKGCPACGGPLRPARWSEINADLLSTDDQIRQMAEWSAQGDRNWTSPDHFSDWEKYLADTERPSWQFRCDQCGHRLLWSREKHDDEE